MKVAGIVNLFTLSQTRNPQRYRHLKLNCQSAVNYIKSFIKSTFFQKKDISPQAVECSDPLTHPQNLPIFPLCVCVIDGYWAQMAAVLWEVVFNIFMKLNLLINSSYSLWLECTVWRVWNSNGSPQSFSSNIIFLIISYRATWFMAGSFPPIEHLQILSSPSSVCRLASLTITRYVIV